MVFEPNVYRLNTSGLATTSALRSLNNSYVMFGVYIHTYVRTYVHASIHTYVYTNIINK